MNNKNNILITCEHASNKIPGKYRSLFSEYQTELNTHLGSDIGAMEVYTHLTKQFKCWHQHGQWSRLLIDLNRSLTHPTLFSEVTRALAPLEKKLIIREHYQPYYDAFNKIVDDYYQQKSTILHFSIHSFTPIFGQRVREVDIGLLYDPQREGESRFVKEWSEQLRQLAPSLRIRRNSPYRGTSIGLTTITRRRLSKAAKYIGIELEINQGLLQNANEITEISQLVRTSLQQTLSANKL